MQKFLQVELILYPNRCKSLTKLMCPQQVGRSLRIAIVHANLEDMDDPEVIELINPVVKVFKPKNKSSMWECCLSVPGEPHVVKL